MMPPRMFCSAQAGECNALLLRTLHWKMQDDREDGRTGNGPQSTTVRHFRQFSSAFCDPGAYSLLAMGVTLKDTCALE